MKYLSTVETAKKWKISDNRVNKLARAGRIPGAVQVGARWMIPDATEKPLDGRTKTAKQKSETADDFFRFAILEHREPASFFPPLSEEELQFKAVSEAFHRGEFEQAQALLPQKVNNRYLRFAALHASAFLAIFLCNRERFFHCYEKLCAELQGDFPHKLEMQEYVHMIDATLGKNEYYKNQFHVIPDYPYHESFLPHLASLSGVFLTFSGENVTEEQLSVHEVTCRMLESTEAYVDLQSLHIYLGSAYCYLKRFDDMTYHFKQALALAEQYELYYVPALQYYYLRDAFTDALRDFPADLKSRLCKISDDVHTRYSKFMDSVSALSIYKLLSGKDFPLLYAAVQGRTNKEIAELLHISEGTVGKRYSEIYAEVGVESKAELIALYRQSTSKSPLKE